MQIRQIDRTDRNDIGTFVRFPLDLYRGHPLWVPPLMDGMRSNLRPGGHPAHKHADAAFFVAESGGEVIARVSAVHNRRHNRHTGRKTGRRDESEASFA